MGETMNAECVATGDHIWNGSSQCVACGARLRCNCGVYVREDNIEKHFKTCPWLERAIQDERAEIESTFG